MAPTRIAFVCEGNAGRSQFAAALAERERDRRGLDVDVVTGGVDPADHVHEEVVEALAEVDVDIRDRVPRKIRPEDVADAEYVVTMGCSVDEFAPPGWDGTAERWDLEHPSAGDLAAAREQRDEIRERVERLFDELEG
ncbi:MAG: low molecular weight phosphatase family protein [Halobacteriaceae archaeon]